jgi:hypothetical protein
MTQKPIIHMQLATESVPFDQTLFRSVRFLHARGSRMLKKRKLTY